MKTITSIDGFEYKTKKSKNSKVVLKKVEVKSNVSFSENVDTVVVVKGNTVLTYDKVTQTVKKVSKVSSFYSKTGRETYLEKLIENVSVQKNEDLLQYI